MLRDGSEDYTDKMPFTAVSVHANELHPVNIGGIKFVPTINPTTIPAQSLILVANNRLALTTEEGTMAGLRGYFQITDPNPARAQELAEQAADGRIMLNFKQPVSTSVVITPESEQSAVSIVRKVIQNNNIYILRGEEKYTIMGDRVR